MSAETPYVIRDDGTGEVLVTEIDFDAMKNMSPGERLARMIAMGRYDDIDSLLTPGYFPVIGTGKRRFRNRIFRFNWDVKNVHCDMRAQESIEVMGSYGFMPGNHMHGFALGAAFPEAQLQTGIIACLGHSARINGKAHIVTLFRHRRERVLRCRDRDSSFLDHWCHLGVQEI